MRWLPLHRVGAPGVAGPALRRLLSHRSARLHPHGPARCGNAAPDLALLEAAQFVLLPPLSDRGDRRSLERLANSERNTAGPLYQEASKLGRVHGRRLA